MYLRYCTLVTIFFALCSSAPGQQIKVLLENEKVRVTEFTALPHEGVCGIGMHSHPPHLTVILQAAKVRVTMPDGKIVEKAPKGDLVFWSEGGTHSVENIDTTIRHSLIIDLKDSVTTHR